jgi:hypothetical protein
MFRLAAGRSKEEEEEAKNEEENTKSPKSSEVLWEKYTYRDNICIQRK